MPQHDVHAAFIAFARLLLDDPRKIKVFDRMAARGAIEHRCSTLSLAAELSSTAINAHALYSRGDFPGSRTRMRLFETAALPLALQAVADLGPLGAVTHLICVSCTGFYAPGLDLQIAAELGLATVERTFVGFMGCYAAFLDHAEPGEIDLWAVHPGGRSVLDAVQSSLDLPDEALATSREILAGYGNMSSATIMFVLKRLMASNPPAGATGCALGFGPGLVAETMLFRAA